MSRKMLLITITSILMLSGNLVVLPPSAAMANGGYPYATYNGPGSSAEQSYWTDDTGNPYSPYHYVYRNCTDFVAWKLSTANGWSVSYSIGNAVSWGTWAAGNGYVVDRKPSVGSVAWWNNSQWGHVAYVTGIVKNASGAVTKVTIEQYNRDWDGNWSAQEINVDGPAGYIHFKDIPETPMPPPIPPGDHNHDGWPDMYAFNKRDVGSGRMVHYVLDGVNSERVLQVGGSPFGWLDGNWNLSVSHDWNGDNTPDFVAINKHDANSGRTVYYVLDGVLPERVVQVGATAFGWTDEHWVFKVGPDFNRDGRPEIYAFDRRDEGTGRTVVFILDGVSPERVLLISRTPFGFTDANWDFAPGPDFNRDDVPDLYAFNKHDTGSGRTVHYVLNGRNPEQVLQVGGSAFGWLDSNWSLFPSRDRNHDGTPDFYAINRRDSGSGKTVFYVLDGTAPERVMIVGATAFSFTDEHWEFGVW